MIPVPPRRVFTTGRKWEAIVGYARAVRIGPSIEICGCAPTNDDGSTVGKGDSTNRRGNACAFIGEALAGVGAGFDDVTRTRIFTTVPRRWREIGRAHGEVFGAIKPVTSLVGVRGLLDPEWLVEIEATAYRAGGLELWLMTSSASGSSWRSSGAYARRRGVHGTRTRPTPRCGPPCWRRLMRFSRRSNEQSMPKLREELGDVLAAGPDAIRHGGAVV